MSFYQQQQEQGMGEKKNIVKIRRIQKKRYKKHICWCDSRRFCSQPKGKKDLDTIKPVENTINKFWLANLMKSRIWKNLYYFVLYLNNSTMQPVHDSNFRQFYFSK